MEVRATPLSLAKYRGCGPAPWVKATMLPYEALAHPKAPFSYTLQLSEIQRPAKEWRKECIRLDHRNLSTSQHPSTVTHVSQPSGNDMPLGAKTAEGSGGKGVSL